MIDGSRRLSGDETSDESRKGKRSTPSFDEGRWSTLGGTIFAPTAKILGLVKVTMMSVGWDEVK